MPGLWDCHVHFYRAQKTTIDGFYQTSQALVGARGAHDLQAILNAGFTSVRELGGYGVELSLRRRGGMPRSSAPSDPPMVQKSSNSARAVGSQAYSMILKVNSFRTLS